MVKVKQKTFNQKFRTRIIFKCCWKNGLNLHWSQIFALLFWNLVCIIFSPIKCVCKNSKAKFQMQMVALKDPQSSEIQPNFSLRSFIYYLCLTFFSKTIQYSVTWETKYVQPNWNKLWTKQKIVNVMPLVEGFLFHKDYFFSWSLRA